MTRRERFEFEPGPTPTLALFLVGGAIVLASIIAVPIFYWSLWRIDVPTGHMAVLTRKTGADVANDDELAPSLEHKGLQIGPLAEGRHFRNPWTWGWEVVPQIEIPQGKVGVRIRLYGDDPSGSEIIAWKDTEKGIVPDVLRPGRYPINAVLAGDSDPRRNYAEIIELHEPLTVPAGYKGVVTNLSGPPPADPNKIVLSAADRGKRGVEPEALEPGTYYINPYVQRINLIDCRSQRFNLSSGGEMGFPSKDGFWVSLEGVIEFRVMPERAAEVFVMYNEDANGRDQTQIAEMVVNKVVVPNARSFCRLRGSNHSGREFISGDTRIKFQEDFQRELKKACDLQGIEIVQALITRINPPQQIAEPVRARQIAVEQRQQYARELLQQESEKQLAIERELNERKQALVEAQRQVVQMVTQAKQAQEIALIEAQKRLKVAEYDVQAAADQATAILSRGTADANVVQFQNEAEAAGWRKAVEAFDGNGEEFARWTMLRKLAPAFRSMMVNTSDSPIMDIFRQYQQQSPPASANLEP